MLNATIPFPALVNLLFGFFAIATGVVVLFYRKNFVFSTGIVVLLFAEGIVAFATGLLSIYEAHIIYKLYFFAYSIIPLLLLQFSEYTLRINYRIRIKFFTLTGTIVLAFVSLFQNDMSHSYFVMTGDIFFVTSLLIIIIHLLKPVLSAQDKLLYSFQFIYLITISALLVIEALKNFSDTNFNQFATGISAILLTHGMILIFTSGGTSRLVQKLPKIIYIFVMSFILVFSFKLLYTEFKIEYLYSLFILCIVILSIYYMFEEVSKKPAQIRSAFLISRLLRLPLNDRLKFLEELRQWEEVKSLNYIEGSQAEGDIVNLNLLFNKAGRVIHKYQVNELSKALARNPDLISGIETVKFYLKKFESDSLFQLSDKGDLVAVKYISGLNPALYANEFSIMSKIVFTVTSAGK